MMVAEHGPEVWERVAASAGVDRDFENMRSYPDAVTYALVEHVSKELGADARDVMFAFGEYWVLETAEKGYGALLDLWGTTFVEFVSNLDSLHARVAETFTELEPPRFCVEAVTEGRVRIFYSSRRAGLAPFVRGLLSGLGKRFDTELKIVEELAPSPREAVFLVDVVTPALPRGRRAG